VEIAIPIVIGIIVLLALLVAGLAAMGRGARQRAEAVQGPDSETLRYHVPAGQDPAAVVAALTSEGFTAVSEPVPTGHDVVVAVREGRERHRARVRATIQHAGGEGPEPAEPVRFTDE
jgi:hypothetical protein